MSKTGNQLRNRLGFLWCSIGLIFWSLPASAQEFVKCDDLRTPQVTISPEMFEDVCIWSKFPTYQNPISYFDDYSWRSFLALVWPAKQRHRGQPDDSLFPGAAGRPTVFETYKAEWEVFQERPASWNEFGGDKPCITPDLIFGDMVLAGFSKFQNITQANLTGPLIAQNGTYVRYSTGFNEKEFKHILNGKLYIKGNLPQKKFEPFPQGAIAIKAAWIEMKGIPRPERFYTRDAWLLNLSSALPKCEKTRVGLVGLHIVAKTPSRPQWIWSTFEHIDNAPGPAGPHPTPFTFNSGNGIPMPDENPVKCPFKPENNSVECPLPPPSPYNVERAKPVHDSGAYSTARTNKKYQSALREKDPNSVWQYYQLVMTQWPIRPFAPDVEGTPAHTFPGKSALGDDATAFSNTTMETMLQKNIGTGCMNCHNTVRTRTEVGQHSGTDFVWSLVTRAIEPNSYTTFSEDDGRPMRRQ